jgi:hypothetical protein
MQTVPTVTNTSATGATPAKQSFGHAFNVRDYGAIGDGKTKDTQAVQKAIDACSAAGGGMVVLPAGRYLSGTIYLKSNVEFHLSAGATLLGSPDRADYNADNNFPENVFFPQDLVSAAHLVIAYRQENVSITGSGTIDGNSSAFFGPLPKGAVATYRYKSTNYPIPSWRPGQMVFFCRCTRVAVRDVRLLNSPYWTLFFLGCDSVKVRGLEIINPPATRNGDGIDIDCSRNVTVSDCVIHSGDDCITVRSAVRILGDTPQPSENITVTNCVLSTPTNAIRVGVGTGQMRRCTFSNIVVKDSGRAISVVSSYTPTSHGATIEQISFSDFVIDANLPIAVAAGPGAKPPGAIRDISFARFRVTASAGSQIAGSPEVPLQRITMSDFQWHIEGGTTNEKFVTDTPSVPSHHGHTGVNGQPALPCVLYGTHLQDSSIENMRVHWGDKISTVWHYGFLLGQSRGVSLRNLVLRQPQDNKGAAVCYRASTGITLSGCRAASDTDTFLLVENSLPDARVRLTGNDFAEAVLPAKSDARIIADGNLHFADTEQ